MSLVSSSPAVTVRIDVRAPTTSTTATTTTPMTLSALSFTPLSVEDWGAQPVLSHEQWQRWVAQHRSECIHSVTLQVPRKSVTAAKSRKTARGKSADAETLPVRAVSLFLPEQEHLHFYTRPTPDAGLDEADTQLSQQQQEEKQTAQANDPRGHVDPARKKHKVEFVAYRRTASLVSMQDESVVRVPVRSGAGDARTDTRKDGQENTHATPQAQAQAQAQPTSYVKLRRQLPHIALASSLWKPLHPDPTLASAPAPPDPADYPVIRAVPLFFAGSQLCGLGTSPVSASGGFRRTWGLKQVNTHAMARRSGSTTPPPLPL